MECEQRLNWLMFAMICPLIAGAPSSMSKRHGSCPEANLNIVGGSFVPSNGYSDGSVLRYICPDGYYPSVQSRRCQYGLWTPKPSARKPPECKKVTCPNPHVLENGDVTPYKNYYYVNDTTTYSCHSDYKFRGSAVRVCKSNGKWNGTTPICGRDSDHCPDPGVPPGSSRTGHVFDIDNKVTYRCDSKLTLIGSKERVCQDGGQWSGTEPQCYAHFTYDTPEEVSEAFSSSLKSNLAVSQQHEGEDQQRKKITLDQGGKLDIYIAVDGSGSIEEKNLDKAKTTIKLLIDKISYYEVSPNYEILMFATDVYRIISMRDYKTIKDEDKIEKVFKDLENFSFEGDRTGTNIAKLYTNIYESMTIEENTNSTTFLETQHIIIVFTDGHANMGGNPIPKVNKIKHLIIKNDPKREKKLDLYVFGIGNDVHKDDMNGLVSQRDQEQYFFMVPDLDQVQEMFDSMIDESTSVELCGIHQNYDNNKRSAFPWLAEINVAMTRSSNCMGSLVTSSYILTAAHCLKNGDTPDKITVHLEKDLKEKVEKFILHPKYNITAKQPRIKEYYEFDVALIQLKEPVTMSANLRPICIPCTKETNGALKLSDSEGTCIRHEELLMSNELVEASFTSKMKRKTETTGSVPKVPEKIRNIKIKRGKYRDACVEDAKKAEGINVTNARDVVTDNFLCSGGNEPQTDDVACKGEFGGATYISKKGRLIQVGVVSWGVKDICTKRNPNPVSQADTRDYHTNLFSADILSFLKKHLGNDAIANPLTFF
ncbi:complement factor B-like [Rhinichthys klamathensis goyatoka]|uniref:complement factor B-like n=1 Tax=Rhinichthys klamathensis goyatoka TaxID=3034132 RepID=UPI0024B5E864|nr:complement factor B-like [Rhinichthys klamathensis goyatoka]